MMRSSLSLLFLLPAVATAQVRGARTVAETNFRGLPRQLMNTVGGDESNNSASSQHRRLAVKGQGADNIAIEVRKGMGMDNSAGTADGMGMDSPTLAPGTTNGPTSTPEGMGMGMDSPTFAPGTTSGPTVAPEGMGMGMDSPTFAPGTTSGPTVAPEGMGMGMDAPTFAPGTTSGPTVTPQAMGMGMGATGGGMGMGAARGGGMGMGSEPATLPIVFPIVGIPIAQTTVTTGGMTGSPDTGGMGMGEDNRGILTTSSVNFVQDVYDAAIAVEVPTPTLKEVGTVFTFRNYTTAMEFDNLYASGLCTRTESRTTTDRGISYCDFTYSIQDTQMSAFSVSGAIMDALTTSTGGLSGGGLLAVTGGSGVYFGARGEVSMTPFFNMGVDGDIFLDPSFYVVNATILV